MARLIAPTSSPGESGTFGLKFSFRAIAVDLADFMRSELRNRFHRQRNIFFVYFQADALQITGRRGGNCRTRSHEWIENDPFAQRQRRANDLTQEMLGLQ